MIHMTSMLEALACCVMLFFPMPFVHSFSFASPNSKGNNNNFDNNDAFSLSDYQKARALETAQTLDASRLHFQILFVDDDNTKGRIAEGILARVAEYNDAMFVLFPASATIDSSRNAPRDAAPSDAVVAACEALGLCSTRATTMGTSFDLSYLDEYDLIIAMDDDIRSLILRSLSVDDQEYYGPKCRLLSEFLSPDFCGIVGDTTVVDGQNKEGDQKLQVLLNMLDFEFREIVAPFSDLVMGRSSNIISQPESQATLTTALILAATGLVRYCLDTIDAQFETAFQSLLEQNFFKREHLVKLNEGNVSNWEDQADDQLRRCSSSITGFFSPEQRKIRIERHIADLRIKFEGNE